MREPLTDATADAPCPVVVAQMVEPLSLLPLTRAHCKLLVVAGDPCQLPPIIAQPAATTGNPPSAGPARSKF